ncbi:MAG: hypothetical protein AB7P56_05700 [Nitrososphaeraceae archaeon]
MKETSSSFLHLSYYDDILTKEIESRKRCRSSKETKYRIILRDTK